MFFSSTVDLSGYTRGCGVWFVTQTTLVKFCYGLGYLCLHHLLSKELTTSVSFLHCSLRCCWPRCQESPSWKGRVWRNGRI